MFLKMFVRYSQSGQISIYYFERTFKIMATNKSYEHIASVGGVTFANDNGTDRQEIIGRICKNSKTNECRFIATLTPTKFVNAQNVTEEAIAVFAGVEQIGLIRRSQLNAVNGMKSAIAIASYYSKTGVYTVNLYKHETPSAKQYAYVKSVCDANNWRMPLYTKQDYTRFITSYKKEAKATISA